MAKEYISREAALKAIYTSTAPALEVKYIPAADVVEVVRCRECYFRELDGADVPVCTGAMAYSHTPDDWFCAAGKPKYGGQNND